MDQELRFSANKYLQHDVAELFDITLGSFDLKSKNKVKWCFYFRTNLNFRTKFSYSTSCPVEGELTRPISLSLKSHRKACNRSSELQR